MNIDYVCLALIDSIANSQGIEQRRAQVSAACPCGRGLSREQPDDAGWPRRIRLAVQGGAGGGGEDAPAIGRAALESTTGISFRGAFQKRYRK